MLTLLYVNRSKYRPYYTYEDYCQGEGRWELIEGMPYAMCPAPDPVHQRVSLLLCVHFLEILERCKKCKVFPAIDWKITEATVVQPDLIICEKIAKKKEFLDFIPQLIVEVLSEATETKDRNEKMELYQSQPVKYYLIFDPQFKKVEIYEFINLKYELVSVSPKTYEFELQGNFTANVDLFDIWE